MKMNINDFHKKIKPIRDTDVYFVHDWTADLHRHVVSMTILHPHKNTMGHKHDNSEELYYFVSGEGKMQLGEDIFPVTAGDIVTVPAGLFHKVYNPAEKDLTLLAFFEKYVGRE